jgi:hypothetical protein
MEMNNSRLLGSQTAKGGFANEKDICDKFNNWQKDEDAKKWLVIMNYKLDEIENVEAVVLHGYKADVNVQVKIKIKNAVDIENLSIKLVSNPKGFNQIDKRPVDTYNTKLNWNIPNDIVSILKRFTGELKPTIPNPRDNRRMFIDEFTKQEQNKLFSFLEKNKSIILNDILRGRGQFTAEWLLVVLKVKNTACHWTLKNINEVINFYDGEIKISSKGSVLIGKILIQRKGGTPDPTSLQFKINPALLFDIK